MSEQVYYHVRIRGTTLGPFRQQQMQQLIQRGQLTRMHEVSKDGASWQKAGEVPELFPPAKEQAADAATTQQPGGSEADAQVSAAATPTASDVVWYYAIAGKEYGPLNESALVRLLQDGVISEDTLVWRDGMVQWEALRTTPLAEHLRPRDPAKAVYEVEANAASHTNEIPDKSIQFLMDCRTWSGVLGVTVLMLMLLWIVLNLWLLLAAPYAVARVVSAVFILIGGAFAVAAVYLLQANAAIAPLRYTASWRQLDLVFTRWRSFWMISAIVTLVCTLLALFLCLFLFAAGMDVFSSLESPPSL